jgi:arylesterase/paraoxonase
MRYTSRRIASSRERRVGSVTKKVAIAALVLGLLILIVAAELLRRSGVFVRISPRFEGQCTPIEMSASAEDIQIDHGTGLAYLSYLDRRGALQGKTSPGTVMLVDLNAEQPRVRAALSSDPPDFQPQGMSLYTPPRGTRKLFVISHPPGQAHRVEIFEQSRTGAFTPVKTVSHPLLTHPNAIVAMGPRQFYVINDSSGLTPLERLKIGVGLKDAPSNLLYYDGQTMRVVAQGLKAPTGLAGNKDRRSLYVGEAAARQLRIFAIDPATGYLKQREVVPLPSAPANITVSEENELWIASHPKLIALVRVLRDPAEARSPTQVFRFIPGAPDEERLTEVFVDNGDRLSAGSVAAVHQDHLLLGSITEPKLLDCRFSATDKSRKGD